MTTVDGMSLWKNIETYKAMNKCWNYTRRGFSGESAHITKYMGKIIGTGISHGEGFIKFDEGIAGADHTDTFTPTPCATVAGGKRRKSIRKSVTRKRKTVRRKHTRRH